MRKETQKIARAFLKGEPASAARTTTDGTTVWLHGNEIARRMPDGGIRLTLAGWPTVTTRDRLNGIAQVMELPVRFFQKDHCAMVRENVSGQWEEYEIGSRETVTYQPG